MSSLQCFNWLTLTHLQDILSHHFIWSLRDFLLKITHHFSNKYCYSLIIFRSKSLFNSFCFCFISLCVCLGSVTDWDSVSQISASNILTVQGVQSVHAYCVQSVQLGWPLASAADKPALIISLDCTINIKYRVYVFIKIIFFHIRLKQRNLTKVVTE